jgi:hypothetical protein
VAGAHAAGEGAALQRADLHPQDFHQAAEPLIPLFEIADEQDRQNRKGDDRADHDPRLLRHLLFFHLCPPIMTGYNSLYYIL